MACIILENGASDRRMVPAGQPYTMMPDEHIVGVDKTCGQTIEVVGPQPIIQVDTSREPTIYEELQNEIGGGMGDWIRFMAAPIAKVMDKKGCTTCEARRIVTNAYAKLKAQHGQLKALKIIKDLWALSMTASGDEVLVRLKEVLHD